MIRRPLSLAIRLTVLFGVAAAVVFPVFGWLIVRSTEHHFAVEDSDELTVIAEAVESLLQTQVAQTDVAALHQRLLDILVGHHDASLQLSDSDNLVLFESVGSDFSQFSMLATDDNSEATIHEVNDRGRFYRVLTRSVAAGPRPNDFWMIIAVPIDHHLEFLGEFRRSLWIMIIASILLMSALGWIAVRQGHAPLHDIVARIRRIGVDRLNTRLDPEAVPGELSELALTFNEMLERVDGAFRRLSEFNADIAHELRTPIASLMTQTEVGASRARSAEEYREILYSNMEEYDRMAQMVGDMLYLAKADSHIQLVETDHVDLGKEVDALFEFYEGWADESGVALRRHGDAKVFVDRLMFRRALGNLISNAVKNAPEGSTVAVRISVREDGVAIIDVENRGQDIFAEHLPRLFDRFYRTEESRKRGHEGVGLGLAIVKSIVVAHAGEISVSSSGGTTRFRISIPTTACQTTISS